MNAVGTASGPLTDEFALVIGESLVDIVPTADGPKEYPGGSTMNTAVGLGRLGRPTALATWLAPDARGQAIIRHLEHSHVKILDGSFGASHTATAEVVFDEQGSGHYVFDLEWQMPPLPEGISPLVVCAGSIGAGLTPGAFGVLESLRELRPRTSICFDPNIRPQIIGPASGVRPLIEDFVRLCDVVKTSDEDLRWLYEGEDPLAAAERWLSWGPSFVVVTRGAAGALGMTKSGTTQVPTQAVQIVDTVGAGDSFMACLVHQMWGRGLLGAARRTGLAARLTAATVGELLGQASAASAITLSRFGADPPWLGELA